MPVRNELEQRLLLVHLGRAHRSSEVHERVIAHLVRAGGDSRELEDLRECAVMARDAVLGGDLEGLGRAMKENTDAQHRLHSGLVTARAQAVIDVATRHGASGWKINGAGGEGGSVSILCGPDAERRRHMEHEVLALDAALQIIPIRLSQDGLWVGRS
jgi:D-glycero-alpha-D-manno-heptose-7-phosphate kinase